MIACGNTDLEALCAGYGFPAITLKCKPQFWHCELQRQALEKGLFDYCNKRQIQYVLYAENTDKNLHYHGAMVFPEQVIAPKRFTSWFNKYYGHVHRAECFDVLGWCRYCRKGVPIIRVAEDGDGYDTLMKENDPVIDNRIYMF